MENENIKSYLAQSLRLFLIVFLLIIVNRALSLVPFVADLYVYKQFSLLSFIASLFSYFLLFTVFEYIKSSKHYVENIFVYLPKAGSLYSYFIYFLSTIYSYYAFHDIFRCFIEEDFMFAYQLVFVGILLYLSFKIILYFYLNSETLSKKILDFIFRIIKFT